MQTININEAGAHLSRLIEQAAAGEEIVIIRNGKPVARLVPPSFTASKPRILGLGKGRYTFPEGFDQLKAAELSDMFENTTKHGT